MKKLIVVAVTAVYASVFAAVESQIVGYATQDISGKKYSAIGVCFSGVAANGTFKLNRFVPAGWDYENDELRILNAANSGTQQVLVWLTAEEAADGGVGTEAGWYDGTEFAYMGDEEFDLGTGFQTSLFSQNVTFTSSGDVFDKPFTLDCSGKKYCIIPNALPRTIKVNEIVPTGWDYENDELRIVDSTNSGTQQVLVWLTAEEAADGGVGTEAGWYDGTEFTYMGNKEIAPGYGFMTSLFSPGVKFNYPAAK